MKNNMKFLIVTSALVSSMLIGSADFAHAATDSASNWPSNWYLGASGDLTWMRHSKTGGGGNVNLGYRFSNYGFSDWRIEAEAGYHGAGGKSGYSSTHYFSYMGNLYYDFNKIYTSSISGWQFTPYIGGGIGNAAVHYGNSSFSNTFKNHENSFAYQGMGGVMLTSTSLPNNVDLSLGYRYLGTDKTNIHSNILELGFRLHF